MRLYDWGLVVVAGILYGGTMIFYNVSHRRRKQRIEEVIAEVKSYNEMFDERYVRAGNLIRGGISMIGEHPRAAHEVLMDLHELALDLIIERSKHGKEQATSEGAQQVAHEVTRREEVVVKSPEREEGHHQDG